MNTPSRRARAVAIALADHRHASMVFAMRAFLAAAGITAALLHLPGLGIL